MKPIGHDLDDIHLAAPSETRIFSALKALMDAISGPKGDIAEAAERYLMRGFPGAPTPSLEGVVLDMLVQLLWLSSKLHINLEDELDRMSADFEAAAQRMREEQRVQDRQRNNRAALGGGLETPQGRCLTMLVCGVTLQPDPKNNTWTWRRATFPDAVVKRLVAGGLASIEGDGASSRYIMITKQGIAAYDKLTADMAEQDASDAGGPPPPAKPALRVVPPADEPIDIDALFSGAGDPPTEEAPFRFR